jgi:HEPN domain-containing protein
VEKALKALIVRRTGDLPPRIHNLMRLAETAGIELLADYALFLGELSMYYIKTRYPEEIRALGATVTRETATEVLGRTEEMIQWLSSAPK